MILSSSSTRYVYVYSFNHQVFDKVQSPEMLLHNLSSVIDIIVYHLSIPNSLARDSILKLVAILSRDMRFCRFPPLTPRGELIQYYDKLLSLLLSLMDQKDPEATSSVFETLILMFRNLNGNDIRNHIAIIRKYYGPLFGNKAPFIRQFACESYCYLLRHMSAKGGASSSNAEYTKHMMKEQVREQMKELTIILKAVSRKANVSDSMILGISSLLFESIRGVGGQSRNHGMEIFNQLLDIVIGEKTLDKTAALPSPSFINVMLELQYDLAE